MLRDLGNQTDAPGIIALNLLDHMLAADRTNEYVLFHGGDAFSGRYARLPNVESLVLRAAGKLVWDQVMVPWAARRERVDVLFHPKHSLPLVGRWKSLMHLRGSEYWVYPEYYERLDLVYQRLMLPLYCRKATHLIVESDYVKRDFEKFLGLRPETMTRIHLAPAPRFRPIGDAAALEAARRTYHLPGAFCLTVTRLRQGRKYYPGKNLVEAIEAFRRSKARARLKFVVVGAHTRDFVATSPLIADDVRRELVVLDRVPQEDLPAIYSQAAFFVFPSSYESFGLPLTEAMACGCPVIASQDGACPEIVGDAAVLIDPRNVWQLADAMDTLAGDAGLREHLRRRGLEVAAGFSWRRAADETLRVIDGLA